MKLLLPDMLTSLKAAEFELTMRKDLREAAKLMKDKPAWFVTAGKVTAADKKPVAAVFVVVKTEAEAKAWQIKLKDASPKPTSGTCKLTPTGPAVDVQLDKVKGDRTAALKAAKLAFKLDKKVSVADPQAKGSQGGPQAGGPQANGSKAESGSDESEAQEAKQELDEIGRGIGAFVDKAPVDNAETLEILKQFQELGLDEAQIKAALKETFG